MNRGTTERCWWCNAISSYYETANVLGRHKMRYYCCPTCGFFQTEPPFWLAESYKSPMTSYDLGGSFNSCYAPGYGVGQPFLPSQILMEEDFAVAMRQAKEAAEQLTPSSKLTRPICP